jgi:hypothetical protein
VLQLRPVIVALTATADMPDPGTGDAVACMP